MLGIKRETDYAVRTVLHLAAVGEGALVQVRDVADQRLLPLSFVRRIVARLRSAGILATARGMGGGIRLAREPSEISLLDVLQAMDDGVGLNQCLESQHSCPLAGSCPVQRVWNETSRMLEGHLAAIRFDALAKDSAHMAAHQRLLKHRRGTKKGEHVAGPPSEEQPGACGRCGFHPPRGK